MRFKVALAAILTIAAAPALAANAVQNGDFEIGDIDSFTWNSTSTSHFYPYSPASNWGLVVPTSYSSVGIARLGGIGEADNNYMRVTPASAFAGIIQTLQPGLKYFSADIKLLNGSANAGIQVFQGNYAVGGFALTESGIDGWQHIVLDLTGLPGDPTASEIRITSFYDPADFLVDNVYAAAAAPPVPEPGEWAMMGAGLAVAGIAARRRRKAA